MEHKRLSFADSPKLLDSLDKTIFYSDARYAAYSASLDVGDIFRCYHNCKDSLTWDNVPETEGMEKFIFVDFL